MKDRRLLKGLRSVALSLDKDASEKTGCFQLLQSIASHCGLCLGDDGLVIASTDLELQKDHPQVRGCASSLSCIAYKLLTALLTVLHTLLQPNKKRKRETGNQLLGQVIISGLPVEPYTAGFYGTAVDKQMLPCMSLMAIAASSQAATVTRLCYRRQHRSSFSTVTAC